MSVNTCIGSLIQQQSVILRSLVAFCCTWQFGDFLHPRWAKCWLWRELRTSTQYQRAVWWELLIELSTQAENGHGGSFVACLLTRVSCTRGIFVSMCLLSRCALTWNGKPSWEESEWTALNRCIIEYELLLWKMYSGWRFRDIHISQSNQGDLMVWRDFYYFAFNISPSVT